MPTTLPRILQFLVAATATTQAAACIYSADERTNPYGRPAPTSLCDPGVAPLEDDCSGLFVDLNAFSNGDGSRSSPYNTWSSAIADPRAASDTIFMCVGTEKLDSTAGVTISAPVIIWGGLDCETWEERGDERTSLVGSVDMVPLRLSSKASGTLLRRINVTAANASKAGGSSIAIIAEGAEARLINCNVTAGGAANGVPGEAAAAGEDGYPGNPGNAALACTADLFLVNPGGQGMTKTCSNGTTAGGAGGESSVAGSNTFDASDGGVGSSSIAPSGAGGGGGKYCSGGLPGTAGADGPPGASAIDDLGTLSITEGYVGGSGASGGRGLPGGGGGGGGGVHGDMCGADAQVGPSGGAGGTGGCGGGGGRGGGPGGSSFAIVAINAPLTLVQTSLTAGSGGKGGDGAPGAPGGLGGYGGKGGAGLDGAIPPACDGGDGGNGGTGGVGGGGHGGHSAGLAFVGQAPVVVSALFEVSNSPALGGDAPGGNAGEIGWACHTLGFDGGECH